MSPAGASTSLGHQHAAKATARGPEADLPHVEEQPGPHCCWEEVAPGTSMAAEPVLGAVLTVSWVTADSQPPLLNDSVSEQQASWL